MLNRLSVPQRGTVSTQRRVSSEMRFRNRLFPNWKKLYGIIPQVSSSCDKDPEKGKSSSNDNFSKNHRFSDHLVSIHSPPLYYKRSISLCGAKIFTDESFLATKRHKKDVPDWCRFFVFFVTLCGHLLNENWFRLRRARISTSDIPLNNMTSH